MQLIPPNEKNDRIRPLSECIIGAWRRRTLVALAERALTDAELIAVAREDQDEVRSFLRHLQEHGLASVSNKGEQKYTISGLVSVGREDSRTRLRVSNDRGEFAEVLFQCD